MELLKALYDYIPTYDDIDFIDEGTKLQILERYEEEPDWVMAAIEESGEKRWFPLMLIAGEGKASYLSELFSPDELELYKGEMLIKLSQIGNRIYAMNYKNKRGWIPAVLVEQVVKTNIKE